MVAKDCRLIRCNPDRVLVPGMHSITNLISNQMMQNNQKPYSIFSLFFVLLLLINADLKANNKLDPVINRVLFSVSKIDNRYYFEIPDSLLGREMTVVTRLKKAPAGIGVDRQQYGGEQENQQVWKWEEHGQQIFIRVIDYSLKADSGSTMLLSVQNSSLNTILYAFEIKKHDLVKHTVTIDVTDFYNGDITALGISDTLRKAYRVSSLDPSRSYIDTIKGFSTNLEVQTIKTYKAQESPTDKSNASITFELNTSMLLLPAIPMKVRIFDHRIGYMTQEQTEFGNGDFPAHIVSYVKRWRLEPKDTAAYNRGELVEPKKQIIFYIDPATPKQWVPYFIQGVNDWQKAFEAAGFKDAIIGRPAPTPGEDPGFSTEDARYNVIRYFASDQENAYGPAVTDPRSGEILESHVGWYHNQIKELHDWYFIQTAAANPKARKVYYTNEEMGDLIRYTVSHEIGHTLGLPHNWGASNAYKTDSLRSKLFTDHHGTSASVMDYARFNYIAQPGDGVTQFNPQVGEYDLWAIQWGYHWFAGKSPQQESLILNRWTIEKAKEPVFFFGKEMTFYDPRAQHEDLGDNAMVAGRYGIANLKQILPNLAKWIFEEGKEKDNLLDYYKQILEQYSRYGNHVVTYVGGVYFTYKTYDQSGSAYEFVSKPLQQSAVQFLIKEIYTTPEWLLDKKELAQIDNALILNKIQSIQYLNLASLLSPDRAARMLDNELKQGEQAYTFRELLSDLHKGLFAGNNPDVFQRTLQRGYIEILKKLIQENNKPVKYLPYINDDRQGYPGINISLSDIKPLVLAELKYIMTQLSATKTAIQKAHCDDLKARIKSVITASKD